jgi:hypothetical protein
VRGHELGDSAGHGGRVVDGNPRHGSGNGDERGVREVRREPPRLGHGEELALLAPDQQHRLSELRYHRGGVDEELRAEARHGRDQVPGHPAITPGRPGEGFRPVAVESVGGHGGQRAPHGGRPAQLQPDHGPGETGERAAGRRRPLEPVGRELVVALAVGQDQPADSPERLVPGGQGQQEQPARRVVDDHGGVVHVEQVEAVEKQPGQRGGRPVRARRER